jgi:hypothetical protein
MQFLDGFGYRGLVVSMPGIKKAAGDERLGQCHVVNLDAQYDPPGAPPLAIAALSFCPAHGSTASSASAPPTSNTAITSARRHTRR